MNLARSARQQFLDAHPGCPRVPIVAALVGPHGAIRHDGLECHGNYRLTEEALVTFHRRRFEVLVGAAPDLLACETIPSLLEARVLVRLLREHPRMRAWISFSCRDGLHSAAGDAITDCARLLDGESQVVALGVNCVAPELVTPLAAAIASATRKPILAYPNSGEVWNAVTRNWEGTAARFTHHVPEWLAAGVSWIGGCCRTTPRDIAQVRAAVTAFAVGRRTGAPE